MDYYFYNHSIKFKKVLNQLKNNNNYFIKEDYTNIDDLLYLDPNINYYSENDQDNNLYGQYDDWEDYWDSIYQ